MSDENDVEVNENDDLREQLEKEVREIARQNRGELTPNLIYEEAKQEGTALHEYFDRKGVWDKDQAQRRWGEVVARGVIRSIKVQVETVEHKVKLVPQFIRNPAKEANEQGYLDLTELKRQTYSSNQTIAEDAEEIARKAVLQALERVKGHLENASRMAEALGCKDLIMEFIDDLQDLTEKVRAKGKPVDSQQGATIQ